MESGEQIVFTSNCEQCENHKTDLGTLKLLEETVNKNFPNWPENKKAELVICWFERGWKQKMALDIERSKKANMEQSQAWKKQNIKAINK